MLIVAFHKTDMDRVEEYEKKISEKLPDQFRTFLIRYNGGETPNTSFRSDRETSDIKGFYGLGNVKYSLDNVMPIKINGADYLPIALDSFGNEFLISFNDGSIYFLNHENDKMTKLSENLKAFLYLCESTSVSKGALKSVEEREKELIEKGRGSMITEALRDMWRAEIEKHSRVSPEEVIL